MKRADAAPPAPIVVSDASAFAVCGLRPRQFRALVRDRDIPYAHVGRRTLVRADLLLHALGLAAEAPSHAAPAAPQWSADTLVARLKRGGGK